MVYATKSNKHDFIINRKGRISNMTLLMPRFTTLGLPTRQRCLVRHHRRHSFYTLLPTGYKFLIKDSLKLGASPCFLLF